jgi:hypothetical protein
VRHCVSQTRIRRCSLGKGRETHTGASQIEMQLRSVSSRAHSRPEIDTLRRLVRGSRFHRMHRVYGRNTVFSSVSRSTRLSPRPRSCDAGKTANCCALEAWERNWTSSGHGCKTIYLTLFLTTNKCISVIHRADYQRVLVEECERLGVDIRLKSEVHEINFDQTTVTLRSGDVVSGNVIIGADGNHEPRQMLS